MAHAFVSGEVRLTVPETVFVELVGELDERCSAKDAMLALLADPFIKNGGAASRVIEFTGPGLRGLSLDERATLTNMTAEAGAFTGLIEPDDRLIEELAALRGVPAAELSAMVVRADPGARHAATVRLDLGALEPMVSTPGDPKNALPLSGLGERVHIDIAYGGSCTGGKRRDMDLYARALAGRKVAPGVTLFIQFGSQLIRRYAEQQGYVDVFRRAGATLLDPACGACIRAGPGVSSSPEQVTVSAINRNFPGRSGPGRVYLASPLTVAASAVAGYITAFARQETS
jgi:3-isopropylmalate/(R)-2-methylmalate dehydratase large subunit